MNRQQLLDIDNPTHEQAATQQLLMSTSMTRLEAIRRVFNEVDQKLYKTALKNMTFSAVNKAINAATKLAKDEEVPDEEIPF